MGDDLPRELQSRTVEHLRDRVAAEFNSQILGAGGTNFCVIEVLVDVDDEPLVQKVKAAKLAGAKVTHAVWQGWHRREGSALVELDVELEGRFEIRLTLDVDGDTPRDWALNLGTAAGLILHFVDLGVSVDDPPTLTTLDVPVKPRDEGATLSQIDDWLRTNSQL